MSKYLALLVVLIALAGCGDTYVPLELNDATPPLVLVAKGTSGVVISDGEGNLYAYDEYNGFAQVIRSSALEAGDTLTPNFEDK